jgi:hypothetical protein
MAVAPAAGGFAAPQAIQGDLALITGKMLRIGLGANIPVLVPSAMIKTQIL